MANTSGPTGAGDVPSARTRVRRLAERGRYDRALIHSILDEGFICHVGVMNEDGPTVLPTAYARIGDRLYLHGAPGNALLRTMATGAPVCIEVTLVDGLVLARSAFHHSINYRSVVVFATATEVQGQEEKRNVLHAIVEHLVPGRSVDARPPTDAELRATRVVSVPLNESSAKVRGGGPIDDEEDLQLPIWAGQLPLALTAGVPINDDPSMNVPCPTYVNQFSRP